MKKHLLWTSLVLLSLIVWSSHKLLNSAINKVDTRLIQANNDFGFRLFAQLVKQDAGKNVFISPYSLAVALQMTYNGALGTTQQAMAQTLALQGMSLRTLNQANATLGKSLQNSDPQVQLAIANSLWAGKGVPFKPDFMQRNRDFYGAKVMNIDLTSPQAEAMINGWVKQQTKGKIDKLVKKGDLEPLTLLVLINAVYFKGIWTTQFDKTKTHEGVFNLSNGKQKKLPMMSQSGKYQYLRGSNFEAVSLPYGGGRMSMYIFLPNKNTTLTEFLRSLTAQNWTNWMSQFRESEGNIALPRFKVEYEQELKKALTALGMGIAFGDADFHGMTPVDTAYISRVRHKTFMEVNEEGTEARAATEVVIKMRGLSGFFLRVDRPFFCAMRDNQTGAVLFMGAIVEPR